MLLLLGMALSVVREEVASRMVQGERKGQQRQQETGAAMMCQVI